MALSSNVIFINWWDRQTEIRPEPGTARPGRLERADISISSYCEHAPVTDLIEVIVNVRLAPLELIPEEAPGELPVVWPARADVLPPAGVSPGRPTAAAPSPAARASAVVLPVAAEAPVPVSGDSVPTISTRLPIIPARSALLDPAITL